MPIKSETIKPTMTQLTEIAKQMWGGFPSPSLVPYKKPAKTTRKYRLTLWHEGVQGLPLQDKDALNQYMKQYIDFVKAKKFDRTFFQGGDPYMIGNDGYQKFPYADQKWLIENYLYKLPEYTTAGLLGIVDPKYIGYYDYTVKGGIWGNNPGYKNNIADQQNFCQTPYRKCSDNNHKLCANMTPYPKSCSPANCAKLTNGAKPYCDAGGCSKYKACNDITDYCSKENNGPCCEQFPVGCPNTLEQFFKYVGELNQQSTNHAKKLSIKPKLITTIAFDGEDFGLYGTDKYGLVQAWQAARRWAPDVNEIGYAHGPYTRPADNWTNAAYPELYWIGELKNNIVQCVGCKNITDLNKSPCKNCLNSIYQKYKNKPQEMLNNFTPYLDTANGGKNSKTPLNMPGTCPLLSIELAHADKTGMGACVQSKFNPVKSPKNNAKNWCGTFDGFGNWDWDCFEKFMDLLADKYNLKDIGVYEFQFVPEAWLSNNSPSGKCTTIESYKKTGSPHSPSKKHCHKKCHKKCYSWLWILLVVVLILLLIGIIIISWKK